MKVDYLAKATLSISESAISGSAVSLIAPGSLAFVVRGMILAHSFPVALTQVPLTINQDMKALEPKVPDSAEYLLRALKGLAPEIIAKVKRSSHGTCRLESSDYLELLIPLPPLEEQHRIVAKVDELMALCDQLEVARAKRKVTRDRLTTATLARLNALDPTTFPSDARFALDALPALTSRDYQIREVRDAILNLAVRGRLVSQRRDEEPASDLLAKVRAQKDHLVKLGKIEMEDPLPELTLEETSEPLPPGWAWERLGNLSEFVTSGSRDWAKHYSQDGPIFVRMGNLSKGHYRLRLDAVQHVKPPGGSEGTRTRLAGGDILISITGEVGMLGLVPEDLGEAYINQHVAMVRPMPVLKGRYLPELLRSPFAQRQFNEPQRGIKNSFRLTDITHLVVPVPPLAEQHRILSRVDELMALCDQLEANLARSDGDRCRLLEALLHEALEAEPGEAA